MHNRTTVDHLSPSHLPHLRPRVQNDWGNFGAQTFIVQISFLWFYFVIARPWTKTLVAGCSNRPMIVHNQKPCFTHYRWMILACSLSGRRLRLAVIYDVQGYPDSSANFVHLLVAYAILMLIGQFVSDAYSSAPSSYYHVW
jgi:hypothetical protein